MTGIVLSLIRNCFNGEWEQITITIYPGHDAEKDNGLPFLLMEFILQTAVTLVPFENVLAESSYFFLLQLN